jgi:hypothetical protein
MSRKKFQRENLRRGNYILPNVFTSLNLLILIFIFIASQSSIALLLCGVLYVISGPFNTLRRYRGMKRKKAEWLEGNEQEPNFA